LKATKIRMIIKAQGRTQKELADKLGIKSAVTMYQKLDDPIKFTMGERRKLARLLKIKLEDIV